MTARVKLTLTEEDQDLFRKAGEALYGKDHPVPRSRVLRELAKRGAGLVIRKKSKPKK